jgi:hypothetical protein
MRMAEGGGNRNRGVGIGRDENRGVEHNFPARYG